GSESGARVCESIYANAEPSDSVATRDAHETENQNDRQSDRNRMHGSEPAEVHDDHNSDKHPQDHQEFSLGEEVGLAGLIDQLGNVEHRFVDGQVLQVGIDRQPETQAKDAD